MEKNKLETLFKALKKASEDFNNLEGKSELQEQIFVKCETLFQELEKQGVNRVFAHGLIIFGTTPECWENLNGV